MILYHSASLYQIIHLDPEAISNHILLKGSCFMSACSGFLTGHVEIYEMQTCYSHERNRCHGWFLPWHGYHMNIMVSQISWQLNCLFNSQPILQANSKENINLPLLALYEVDSHHKGPVMYKAFHGMTSSCMNSSNGICKTFDLILMSKLSSRLLCL